MLENLEQLVRENSQELVINNAQIPNEQNENVIQAASGSIVDVLKEKVGSGGIGDVISSFTQGGNGSGLEQITASFTDKLGALGINAETAKSIGASLIPMVMSKFFNKTADPNDSSFDLQEILGKLGGADGKFDFNDVKDLLGGGGKDGEEGGGLLDRLKGLF
ncbi:hypothetical protein [Pedobacter sp. SL55]|uniref:hypothetical protein n=1 Tax=Pedobacter sp. SL55 TaxID=2995161 RepID=UPI002271DE1B|nr:hypothetical protein [Pedobacter sp. SL55]WAC42217.1 hypothetical protein OVA16_07640 [Pedobacter sp. SL55]